MMMSKQFKNETINKLNKTTIEKFEDVKQTGNYAKRFDTLSKSAIRKILKRFNKKRINKLINDQLITLDRITRDKFYKNIENSIGISINELIAQDAMNETMNALLIETQKYINDNLDGALKYFSDNALRLMSQGLSFEDIETGYAEDVTKRASNISMVARTQMATFNGLMTKNRMQKLGVTQAIWVTAGDERVRPAHEKRDGRVYDLKTGLNGLYPGVDYQCRCTSKAIIDPATI